MKNKSKFRLHPSITLAATLLAHAAAPHAFAATYWWDSNGADAGFGDAGGIWAAPTIGDATQGWSTSSTGELLPDDITTTFEDGVRFGSGTDSIGAITVEVEDVVEVNSIVYNTGSGPVTLTGGTIALGGSGPQIRANRLGQVIASEIELNANATFMTGINGNPVLHFTGPITGNHNVTFTTPGTVNGTSGQASFIRLAATHSYTGNTLITSANQNNHLFVQITTDDALPPTTVLTLDGGNAVTNGRRVELVLSGNDQTLAGLANVVRNNRAQRIVNGYNDAAAAPATLTLNTTSDFSFSGNLNGAGLSLVKTGPGTQRLTSGNSHTGTTTISEGKLVGATGGNHANSDVTVDAEGAVYSVAITNNAASWTCKSLTFTAPATLEFDFGTLTPGFTTPPLVITDLADFSTAAPLVDVIIAEALPPGTYPLATWGALDGEAPTDDDLTISMVGDGTAAGLSVTDNTLNLVISGTSAGIVKANNTNNLNLGTSWVGGQAPGADEVALWNNTVTSANTTSLGADITWGAIAVTNPGGPVTINAGNALTLGAAGFAIDMGDATADLTLNSALNMSGNHVWNVGTGRTLAVNGEINGPHSITKLGAGTAALGGFNNHTGDTTVSQGTLRIDTDDALPFGAGFGSVVVNGTLDLNGNNQGVNNLSGSGTVDNSASGSEATLTVNSTANSTFSGSLDNNAFGATLNLVKTGTGALVLGGENTMGGTIEVQGGTLAFANTMPFDFVQDISLAGGSTLRPDAVNALVIAPITVGEAGTTVSINAPSIVGGGGTSPVPVAFDDSISGPGNVRFVGTQNTNAYGYIDLNASSDYEGSTLITCVGSTNTNIFVRLGTQDALPPTTVVTLHGGNGAGGGRFAVINLNGNNQTLAGLTNIPVSNRQQAVRNTSGSPAVLTINNTEDFTYGGLLGNGGANMGLTKAGPGTFTLTGSNAYTGDTTVTGGTLALGASNVLADVTAVSLGDATLAIGGGFSDTLGTLEVNGTATLNVGPDGALTFADSSEMSWTGTLNITGSFVSGASLRFGTDASGLTAEQVALISGGGLSDIAINDSGFITATVEAGGYAVWAAANVGGQGPELDFDGDGVANGVEFFLNAAPGFTALPTLDASNTITWTNGGNIPASAYGTQFVIETSGNLASWTPVPVTDLTTNTGDIGSPGVLSYTLGGGAPRFLRLKVMPE